MPTIAEHLEPHTVSIDELHGTYSPMLHTVNELIGVVPDCDTYLEIWPPGFRTYNLCVPNFLNLPASIVKRDGVKAQMGLAMYIASRAAGCPYCSAHTCSFALRRGATREAIDGSNRTDLEQAVVDLAEAMSNTPAEWDPAVVDRVGRFLSADDIEWVAMSVGMMGFLNKFMDAIAVPLELEAINDVAELIEPTGWDVGQSGWRNGARERLNATVPVDSAATIGRVLRRGPKAVKIERGWTKHLPKTAPDLRKYLLTAYGVDVALLTRFRHTTPMRALAAMLDQNLDPSLSEVGVGRKALAGLVFANEVDNEMLRTHAHALLVANRVDTGVINAVAAGGVPRGDEVTAAVVAFAQAIAPSPAMVTDELAAEVTSMLSPAQVIEVAVYVSVQQAMHRMSLFYS
ncbi:MAG: carboxymuconolactone decarboxylase family protein [Ilumatobacter sp.]